MSELVGVVIRQAAVIAFLYWVVKDDPPPQKRIIKIRGPYWLRFVVFFLIFMGLNSLAIDVSLLLSSSVEAYVAENVRFNSRDVVLYGGLSLLFVLMSRR